MNKIAASFIIAALLTTAATAYAQSSRSPVWSLLYPPIGCTEQTESVKNGKIIVKFKTLEIAERIKDWFSQR